MVNTDLVRFSKFLSWVLRHKPGAIGLTLDAQGWVRVDDLLRQSNLHDVPLTRELLLVVVAQDNKQRYALSAYGVLIRANQGHSLAIDLDLPPPPPPTLLYHGTAMRFLDSMRTHGLKPGKRQHVHLSLNEAAARKVGTRHGQPVVLTVLAGRMHDDGYSFYLSAHGVWLTAHVPPVYLVAPSS